uniref:Mos1 transposase HTH domain-containing protein n=1 Tax=Rhodnius prolixus TaxID=13249 RepID=T1IC57_RHOPR
MSKTRIYEWYKRFQDGRENIEDDERPGRPSTSTTDENVKKVKEMAGFITFTYHDERASHFPGVMEGTYCTSANSLYYNR